MEHLIYIEEKKIKEEDLLALYDSLGWTSYTKNPQTLIQGIHNSLKVITVWDDSLLVGLIRVVGDGHTIIYIQDILILPEYQHKGIGTYLLERILYQYKEVRQKVLLTDNEESTKAFYRKVGFKEAEEVGCVSFVKLQ